MGKQWFLSAATILGGVAALWYFWDKLRSRFSAVRRAAVAACADDEGWTRMGFAGLDWEVRRAVHEVDEGDFRTNAVRGPFCKKCKMNLSDHMPQEIRPPVKRSDSYRYECPRCKTLVGRINGTEFCAYPDVGPNTLPLDLDKVKIRVFEEAQAAGRRGARS